MARVEAEGPVPCELMFLGEAPSWEDAIEGRPFVGKAGKQLWADMLRHVDLDRSDFYITNLIKHDLPKGKDPKPEQIGAALPEFLDELERVHPRVIVTTGGFATRAVLGDVKMNDVHGIPHMVEIAGCHYCCFPIYHPAAGLSNKGFLSVFAHDLKRLRSFLDDDLLPWAPSGRLLSPQWLTPGAMRRLGAIRGKVTVAVDTEGWGEWGLSFSCDGEQGYVIRNTDHNQIGWFAHWIRDAWQVVGHNLLHDLPVLSAMGITLDGLTLHDTQVLAYHDMLTTGSAVLESESQNLGTLAYRELGVKLGELTDCAGVDLDARIIPYTNEVMTYAGADPIATWRLFQVYDERGITEQRPYQIDMSQIGLVEEMVDHGLPFDLEAAVSYYADVLDKLEACTEDLRTRAARFGNRDFNPGSHPQVRELLTRKIGLRIRKRTKGGLASTNEKALADHQAHPFVKKIQEHRELVKLKGTYAEPLLEELSR